MTPPSKPRAPLRRHATGGKGSNSAQLRHYNERVVLDAIRRRGQASKADIARHAKLTPPAVSRIVDTLLVAGYVEQKGKRFGQKGQPSVMFGLAAEGGFSLGLHLGRRTLDAVLIDFAGTVRLTESHEYDYPEPEAVQRIGNAAIARLRATLGSGAGRLIGIGISAPYFLGGWEEELAFPTDASARWREVDLAGFFREAGSLPLFVENDASAAAAAELVYGAGTRYRDFIHLSINTMIGGGLVIDGVLQTGPNGNAAAFGPMPVTPSRLASVARPSGPFDILLRRASIYGLINHLRWSGSEINRVRELDPMPAEARAPFGEWQEDCADALAQAIISAIAVIDVEAVVIDGLLPRALLQDTVAKVQRRFGEITPSGLVLPEIIAGTVGPQASAIGASILPIHTLFGPDSGVLTRKAVDKKPLMIRKRG
ncbi:ROK family transcriptional regulator [Mesorhizobium sp. CN2-181]|uniref:ROK family transcriptional regulator n=1 Tax=Mesorhizobium yinganensis TaxID=3157707 RepID=UPI0032B79FBE